MNYLTIFWDADFGLDIFGFTLRWYSLLFAMGFVLGYQLMIRIYKKEGIDIKLMDSFLTYAVIATIVGARLGHCFFYDWEYYSQHPLEILQVWQGGLASHGAAIALIIAMYFYGKKLTKYFSGEQKERKAMLYTLDRLVITVALAGCFIRFGNWMNSEIYGKIDNSSIETVFVKNIERPLGETRYSQEIKYATAIFTGESLETDSLTYPILSVTAYPRVPFNQPQVNALFGNIAQYFNTQDINDLHAIVLADTEPVINNDGSFTFRVLGVPRLPTQLFESGAYLLIFFILYALYRKGNFALRNGFLFGTFLVLVFGFRFVVEFFKANQTAFEEGMSLNMGQWLSIPLVLIGLVMMAFAKPVELTNTEKK
ncbi:MAG: prolipoprotein diacylglyceryl transferase [Bacteroidetes bacterium]|nr:MAG: prolipoprotein diacylglyceryl transferase [Bacteroidota bacterium]